MLIIIAFILLFFWPFFVGFFGEVWKDLQIYYIQQRLNHYTRKYRNAGTCKAASNWFKLVRKAESLGCSINCTIDSPGNGEAQINIKLCR